MNIGNLSLIWIFKQKEIDKIIFGVDCLLHLQNNIKTIKKLSKKLLKLLSKINYITTKL